MENEQQNAVQTVQQHQNAQMPTINFQGGQTPNNLITPNSEPIVPVGKKAGDLVERAFEQAVVNQVVNNQSVQDDLLKSAEKVIHSKTNAIQSQVELEDKTIHFNNKKGACECFGYNETTTEKWAVDYMNIWHNVMTAIWVTIGMVTFAPITFVAKKIKVIFKAAWLAILLAVIIYLIVITSPIWGDYVISWLGSLMKSANEVAPALESGLEQISDIGQQISESVSEVAENVPTETIFKHFWF